MAGSEEPVEIRLDQLLVLRNVTAGLDWAVVGAILAVAEDKVV